MAQQEDIKKTYDWIDPFFRWGLGETTDISGAYYNGDFSLTLEQAQKKKHEYILESINFQKGMRVLDIGCGWGPILQAVKDKGGEAIGITLSRAQAASCQKNCLKAYVKDWKELHVEDYGPFGAIVCVGAFEHFCSVEEFRAGKQDEIYASFFDLCSRLLSPQGRVYLQTMVWDKRPSFEAISLDAPKGSDEHLLALLGKFYPGSWIPESKEQIVKDAKDFCLIEVNSGRNDYKQTMKAWGKKTHWRKLFPLIVLYSPQLLLKYATDKDFRYQLESMRLGANKLAFERGILEHYRMIFEKS